MNSNDITSQIELDKMLVNCYFEDPVWNKSKSDNETRISCKMRIEKSANSDKRIY